MQTTPRKMIEKALREIFIYTIHDSPPLRLGDRLRVTREIVRSRVFRPTGRGSNTDIVETIRIPVGDILEVCEFNDDDVLYTENLTRTVPGLENEGNCVCFDPDHPWYRVAKLEADNSD